MVQRVNIFRGCSYSKDIVVLNDFEIPYLEEWSDIECWESAWKSFEGSCELLSLNLILTLYNQWANFVQTRHTCKNNTFCTSRVIFIAKTDMPSPVDCAIVHKASLLHKCTHSQLSVQSGQTRSSKCELSCFRSKVSESQQRGRLILVVRGIQGHSQHPSESKSLLLLK